MMQHGVMQNLIDVLEQAFDGLGVRVPLNVIEDLAVTVHRAMTLQTRHYHNLGHVFGFMDPPDSIRTLAALFHDIIYYQVDQVIFPGLDILLQPYIEIKNGEISLTRYLARGDVGVRMAMVMFAFEPGQTLPPLGGLNEFLSSLVAVKKLEKLISSQDLLRVIACIEATIPFRGVNERGESPPEALARRMTAVNQTLECGLTEEEIIQAIQAAVSFSNRDVSSFSEEDAAEFLDITWLLLPETNEALRLRGVYTIGQYRQALEKMESFMSRLNPDVIYNHYRGVPQPEVFARLVSVARSNLQVGVRYLHVKLVTIALLEALAEVTGGDAPLSLFMGDLPSQHAGDARRMEEYLPELEVPDWLEVGDMVYALLETGRASDSGFDTQNAPLSFFIYKTLGQQGVEQHLLLAREMFRGDLSSEAFLRAVHPGVLSVVAQACAAMVPTRKDVLLAYRA